ncbi:hypothetical protein LTR15_005593 [Elasticomyces elasticus]|nr:hypothetical protein LTR15_005593 [Elasticomyces elasticus]
MPELVIRISTDGQELVVDAALASLHSASIRRHLKEQKNKQSLIRAGWLFGKGADIHEPITIDIPGIDAVAWATWTDHIDASQALNFTPTGLSRKQIIHLFVNSLILGRRIEDRTFVNAALAALTEYANQFLLNDETLSNTPSLTDVLAAMSSAKGSDELPVSTCRLLAKLAVIELQNTATDELEEQKICVQQAELATQEKSDEIQRLHRIQAELEGMMEMEKKCRATAQGELTTVRTSRADLEEKKKAKEKENRTLKAQLKKLQVEHQAEVAKLRQRIMLEVESGLTVSGQSDGSATSNVEDALDPQPKSGKAMAVADTVPAQQTSNTTMTNSTKAPPRKTTSPPFRPADVHSPAPRQLSKVDPLTSSKRKRNEDSNTDIEAPYKRSTQAMSTNAVRGKVASTDTKRKSTPTSAKNMKSRLDRNHPIVLDDDEDFDDLFDDDDDEDQMYD